MKNFLYIWAISLALMLVLDYIWFSLTLEKIYKPYLGHILSGKFNYSVAAAFYLIYSCGLSYLIILQGLEANHTVFKILCNGFVLGFIAYGAYDLTNQATLKDWPIFITAIDMLWGGVVTAAVSAISYKIICFAN
jgi:uncharacterized membrane protein